MTALIHQKTKSKENNLIFKKNCRTIRATYLEERVKEASQKVKLQEERKPQTLLTYKKQGESEVPLLSMTKKRVGVLQPTIESNTASDEVTPELRDVEQKE